MTLFQIPESGVAAGLGGLRPPGEDDLADAFARASWSGIAEPGDAVAGALIATLGAAAALDALIAHSDAESFARDLLGRGEATGTRRSLIQGHRRWRTRLQARDVFDQLEAARRRGARLLLPRDPEWPSGVDDLGPHAPTALWVLGDTAALHGRPSVALVGARTATAYGEEVASEAASGLVGRGVVVVSGGAYGIDGIAHRATLASRGTTVAFLAGGVDRFYPPRNSGLLARVAATGAVVAELPCGAEPTRWRFLQRNRLIAAASGATVVVEAGRRSGSINTAGHAAALGRPLGAVPGPVTSPTSEGCHRLLREYDAVCVTDAAEMAALVLGDGALELPPSAPRQDPVVVRVLDAMSTAPRALVEIARRSGLAIGEVESVLGLLELDGAVDETGDGWRRVR